MPIYEYFCDQCQDKFEALRPIRESSDPVPCPQCYRDSKRMMPTSFTAFTVRDGYPRSIPDTGKYYHLGKEVSKPVTGGVRINEHEEINIDEPAPAETKAEKEAMKERRAVVKKEMARIKRDEGSPKEWKDDS